MSSKKQDTTKLSIRASKYFIIGITLTIINFCIYTLLIRTLFNNDNNFLWLATIISCIIVTFLGYFLHSKITWRERNPGKTGILKFFIWNLAIAIAISPFLTWFFGLIIPIYEFAFNISSALHLPFDYNFIESTGIFCFTGFVTMLLNYLFYDKIIFGNQLNKTSAADTDTTQSV